MDAIYYARKHVRWIASFRRHSFLIILCCTPLASTLLLRSSFLSGRFDSATNDPLATIIPGVAEKLKRTNGTAGGRSKRQCSWLPLNSSCSRSFRIHDPLISRIDLQPPHGSIWMLVTKHFFYKYNMSHILYRNLWFCNE